jgi:hypothetical protein
MRALVLSSAAVAALLLGAQSGVVLADTYVDASFSGNTNPGNANAQAPFAAGPVTGTFVFDQNLVPSASSGLTNVAFSSFPAAASIPPATLFNISYDGLHFNFSQDTSFGFGGTGPLIQYNNGQFNGFVFTTDFTLGGKQYQFADQGPFFSIDLLVNGVPGQQFVSGTLNIGPGSLTGETPFTPPAPVPLPPSVVLLGAALAGLLVFRRRKPSDSGYSPDSFGALPS